MAISDQCVPLFHEYIKDIINKSSIKQVDIAKELGFSNPNIITMFKQGKTKVPLEKVPEFAKILSLDPKMLLRRAMLEYCPELFRVIEKTFGMALTKNEEEIVNEIRRLSNGKDPGLKTIKSRIAIEKFVDELT